MPTTPKKTEEDILFEEKNRKWKLKKKGIILSEEEEIIEKNGEVKAHLANAIKERVRYIRSIPLRYVRPSGW